MPLRDPLRYLWDSINHPRGGAFLLLFSAIALAFSPFVPFLPRILAGVWLIFSAVRTADEAASWARSRGQSPRESLEKREDFRTATVPLTPEETAARLSLSFTSPFWKAKVYRERTRFYFEARGLIPAHLLKLLLLSGALAALLGLLFASITDKAVQSLMVPGEILNLEGTGFSFRLEDVSPDGLEGRGTILTRDRVVKAGGIAPGRPLLAGPYVAVPFGKNPALRMKVTGDEPFILYPGGREFHGEVSIPFFMPNDEKYVFLPERRLILRFILMPGPDARFLVEVFEEGAERTQFRKEVTGPESLEAKGVEVSVAPAACLRVRFARVISLWVATSGFIIVAAAFLLWFAVPAGKVFGFIQKEEKVRVNWAQEDPFKLPPFVRMMG